MFDAIARRYDFLNHLLSAGLDVHWRRRALSALDLKHGESLLDVCTGTADVAIAAMRSRTPPARVIGVDFAGAMLAVARAKIARASLTKSIPLVRGDATGLPIRDGSVDAVTVTFGIRNVADPAAACREICRALGPRGRLAILEFSMPERAVLKMVYGVYFRRILPAIGRAISGHAGAYAYLPASVGSFPPPAQFAATLGAAGFSRVRAIPLTFGTVQLYLAEKA